MFFSIQMNSQISTLHSQFIRVAIVEDHKMIAEGLERLIHDGETILVTGKAYSAAECLKLLESEQPDVLMLDIGLPDVGGINLCGQIKKKYPQLKVLMLTSYSEMTTIRRALDAGADGYVLKNSMQEELIEGIRTVSSGERFLCDEVNMVIQNYESSPLELTRRELELLQLIVEGYTQPQLADKMCLGVQTIRSYRKNLNIKLGAHNTAQLLQNAKAMKLV